MENPALQEEITRVMEMPDVKKRFSAMSVVPTSSTPEEFSKIIASEIAVWKQLAIDNNIKAN